MRLVTFENCGQASPGVRIGERIHDISWFAPTTEMVIALLATALLDVGAGIAAAIVLGAAATGALVMGWALVASSVHYATDTLGGFCIAVAVVPLTAWCTDLVGDRITADYRVRPPA